MVSNFISLVKIDSMTCLALQKSVTNNVNDLLIGVPQLARDGTSKTICTATGSIINDIATRSNYEVGRARVNCLSKDFGVGCAS